MDDDKLKAKRPVPPRPKATALAKAGITIPTTNGTQIIAKGVSLHT